MIKDDEQKIIDDLKAAGFAEVDVFPIPPDEDLPPHTHDVRTVHHILEGGLIIIDADGNMKKYHPGDRVEFPPGTTHIARGMTNNGRMIVGFTR